MRETNNNNNKKKKVENTFFNSNIKLKISGRDGPTLRVMASQNLQDFTF